MSAPEPHTETAMPVIPANAPNGMTPERLADMLARIERNKNNPRRAEYNRLMEEAITEYRKQIQEDAERELAEESK